MEFKHPDVVDRVIEFISFRFDQEVDRWQVIAAICLALLVILYSGYNIYRAWSAREVKVISTNANEKKAGAGNGKNADENDRWIFVYLCGAVRRPGVYRVGAGTRLNAAIALAGGLAAEGDGNAVNMARVVADGERIYVPKVGEKVSTTTSSEGLESRIDLNKANAAAIDTVPGIGPTLAARIIDYRQKRNGFTDIAQLGEVEGIGPKILDKIKPYVYVE